MDQIQIGKFIAEERKNKKLTQQQLADLLGISNKTVSKWECGGGFPEISLVLPLCEALDINVNELLSGKRLSDVDYQMRAEENMMDFMKEKETNRRLFRLSCVTGAIATVAFIALILVVVTYTDVIALPVKIALVTIACVLFAVGLVVFAQGERTVGYYRCRHCGETFVPKFTPYFVSMHIGTTRHMKCPHCGKWGWCKKVMSKET